MTDLNRRQSLCRSDATTAELTGHLKLFFLLEPTYDFFNQTKRNDGNEPFSVTIPVSIFCILCILQTLILFIPALVIFFHVKLVAGRDLHHALQLMRLEWSLDHLPAILKFGSQAWGRTTFNWLTASPLNRVRSWDFYLQQYILFLLLFNWNFVQVFSVNFTQCKHSVKHSISICWYLVCLKAVDAIINSMHSNAFKFSLLIV